MQAGHWWDLRPKEAVMGPGCLLPTGALCTLYSPYACQTCGPFAPNPYMCSSSPHRKQDPRGGGARSGLRYQPSPGTAPFPPPG